MKAKFGRLSYRTRMFVGILLISLLPLCIIGVFSYSTYIREISEQMDATTQSIANQTRDRVSNVMTSIVEHYVQAVQNADVEWLATEADIPYDHFTEVNAAIKHFRGSSFIYEYISAYTYINRASDFVISPNGLQRYSDMTNHGDMESLIMPSGDRVYYRIHWHNNMAALTSLREYELAIAPRGTADLRGYLLVMQLPLDAESIDQALIVKLDTVYLYRMMMRDLDKYSVVVLDENRNVFMASSDALAAYCIDNYDALGRLTAPTLVNVGEDEQYRLATAQSDSDNLMFFVGYDQELIQEGADRILSLFGVLAIAIVVLTVLSWVGSILLYRPIMQLASSVGTKGGKKGHEIEQITQEMTQLVGTNTNMERIIDDQRELLTQTFITRAFRGELTSALIEEQAQQLRLVPEPCYCVLACRLLISEHTDIDSVDESALRILFVENLPPALLSMLYVRPVNDRNAIVLLLGAPDADALQTKAEALYQGLAAYSEKEMGLPLYVGVSSCVDSLILCRTAFLESIEALKSDMLTESGAPGGINYYTDIHAEQIMIGAGYESWEQEIRAAIDECNRGKAARCLAEFVADLPGWVNARHDNALRINRFITAILSVLHDAGLSLDEVFAQNEQTLFRQAGTLCNAEELHRFIMHSVIDPSIRALEVFREGSTPMMRIKELVEKTSGNITIAECSSSLGYHTSYIWRILKTHTGMSFAEYTAQVKLEAAKAMLLQSDATIADIASALSYTNAQNFIRFFSKHEGMTPGKYRQEHRASSAKA